MQRAPASSAVASAHADEYTHIVSIQGATDVFELAIYSLM